MTEIFSHSSAARLIACPGSHDMEKKYPKRKDKDRFDEYQLANQIAFDTLKEIINGKTGFKASSEATIEMQNGANIFSEYALKTIDNNEYKIVGEMLFSKKDETLHVIDYCFGHRYVEVYNNWKMISTTAEIIEEYADIHYIEFHVVQPRGYHGNTTRRWQTSFHFFSSLKCQLIDSRKNMHSKLVPNPECRFCPAAHACKALQNASYEVVDLPKGDFNLSSNELGEELKMLKSAVELLNARILGLEEEAIAKLKSGIRIPYFRLQETLGRRKWSKSAEELIGLSELFGIDIKKPVEVVTPIQAAKLKWPESLIERDSFIPRGELKLVMENEKNLRKIFDK